MGEQSAGHCRDTRLCTVGVPGCDTLLLDPHAAELPDHVCPPVFRRSIECAAERGTVPAMLRDFWPLPAGRRSLEEWRAVARPPLGPEHLPAPLTDLAAAWVGLIVERRVPGGTVRLLGLCEEEVDPHSEAASRAVFLEPVVQTERTSIVPDEVHRVERHLALWYQRVILERAVSTGGRPPGPSLSPERLRMLHAHAVADLLRNHEPLTMLRIATAMGVSRHSLRRYIKAGILPSVKHQS